MAPFALLLAFALAGTIRGELREKRQLFGSRIRSSQQQRQTIQPARLSAQQQVFQPVPVLNDVSQFQPQQSPQQRFQPQPGSVQRPVVNFVSRSHEDQLRQQSVEGDGVQEPLGLPSGATLLFGNIVSTFSCQNQGYGYYADVGNDCRLFHICNPVVYPDGRAETFQFSFFCGNQTVFDQSQLTCMHPQDAIPCQESGNWLFRNQEFGVIPERRNNFI